MTTDNDWYVPEGYIDSNIAVAIESPLMQSSKNGPPHFYTMTGVFLSQTGSTVVLRLSDSEATIPKKRIMYVAKLSKIDLAPVTTLVTR